MQQFEYKVVPAPDKGTKVKGLRTPAERYARALSDLMNQLSQDGWEYWRADTLPSEERKGLTGSVTVFHNLLVFRRPSAEVLAQAAQGRLPPPTATPVLASALSAGDSWGAKATPKGSAATFPPPAATIPPPAATIPAPAAVVPAPAAVAAAAPLRPFAPEGRAPSLSAQRGWSEDIPPTTSPVAPPVTPAETGAGSVALDTADHTGHDTPYEPPHEAAPHSETTYSEVPYSEVPYSAAPDAAPPAEDHDEVENLFYTDVHDDSTRDTESGDDETHDDVTSPDDKSRP